jgi:hypothetical protein
VSYYVSGGRYADTTFRVLIDPAPTVGPFAAYDEALDAWRERARATIDYAAVRYQIVWRDDSGESPASTTHASDAVA